MTHHQDTSSLKASNHTKALALSALRSAYPSVNCHKSALSFGDHVHDFGYVLVNGEYFVPFSFIHRLADEIHACSYEYHETLNVKNMVSRNFYDSLSEVERKVLGLCFLRLAATGWLDIFVSDRDLTNPQ